MSSHAKTIKLFFDHASPPSRAVMTFLKIAGIPNVSYQEIRINKNEHKSESFAQINPLCQLPVMIESIDAALNGAGNPK